MGNFNIIKPMLLSESDKPFNNKDYVYEIKFDGIRALIYIDKDIKIISRNGKILNNIYPELLSIKNIINNKCIFDGEIVLMYKDKPSFSKLQERNLLKNKYKINEYKNKYPVTFIVFDILYENKELINLELQERIKILKKYKDTKYFVKSRIFEDGIKLFNLIKKQNLEGIVAKLKTSKYYPNIRSKEWIKIKNILVDEFYICGYLEKENIVSLVLGEKIENGFKFVSKVKIAKKSSVFKLIKKVKVTKNILSDFNEEYIFIVPIYKCRVEFLEKTNNNHLRHPVFKEIVDMSTKKG